MFPIGDDNTGRRSTPIVTYVLIAINVVVFLLELQQGDSFVREWAFTPAKFGAQPASQVDNIFTAMFLHGGWMHLFGNMLYLWIFGDNVEDRLGKPLYLLFYLVTGIAATMAQYAVVPGSSIPNVGASGAIAGVLGAYLVMFPKARVNVIVPGGMVMALPALIVLGFWMVLQVFSGVGAIATTDETASTGGVAYMAHVGGFIAGMVLGVLSKPFVGRT
ncbi:MAG: rhomboid family intramembrane serine protease [Hyphomicrobiaceae bacterium]|nr:rhomboid family intramembrane serine protease [Hyphomicrobiaceae bacterium]